MIGQSRGGGGGGGGEMMQASMMMRGSAMESEQSMRAPGSMPMKSAKRRKVTSEVAGGKKRMNDAVSTKLYKLSKK